MGYLDSKLNQDIDQIVHRSLTSKSRQRNTYGMGPTSLVDPSSILDEMRMCKSQEEINYYAKVCRFSLHGTFYCNGKNSLTGD